ncbi:MAG: hypothetical protein Q9188_005111 [Gyalolechia gomerana]
MQVQSIIVPQQPSDAQCGGYGLFADFTWDLQQPAPAGKSIRTSIRQELKVQIIIVWQDEDKNWKVLCGWYVWNKREFFRPKWNPVDPSDPNTNPRKYDHLHSTGVALACMRSRGQPPEQRTSLVENLYCSPNRLLARAQPRNSLRKSFLDSMPQPLFDPALPELSYAESVRPFD